MKRDITRKIQDFRDINWNAIASSSGTQGALMKAVIGENHYKLSSFNAHDGFYGHESVNELIASRLLDILGVPHTGYRLIRALVKVDGVEYATWLCTSKDYRKAGEHGVGLETFYDLRRSDREPPLDLCVRMGWGKEIAQMMVADFLIRNMDRHGSNIEVLVDRHGDVRVAPMFDFGLSLVQFYNRDRVASISQFDVMADAPANNFVGTSSLFRNLEMLPEPVVLPALKSEYKGEVLRGLDGIILPAQLEKIWELISRRWAYYEAFCRRA